MNSYLHLDNPPYHKLLNQPSNHNRRSNSKSNNTEPTTRPSLRSDRRTPASYISEVFSYNMHNHSYYPTEMHVSKIETVSDPTLSGQGANRARSQDPRSLASGSDLSRRVTEGGRLKDGSKESGGKDKQQNNNSSHQSLSEMHCVYRMDRASQRPNSMSRPRLSDGRARVVWDEDKNPKDAMNGVLTVEALQQWVPDTRQRGGTRELMTPILSLQFLNVCQKKIAARHAKKPELEDQQTSSSSGLVQKKTSAIPLLSLSNPATKKNQNNNRSGLSMEDCPHLPDVSSKTSLSSLKSVSGTDLLVESLSDIASAGNDSEGISLQEEVSKRPADLEQKLGMNRGLPDVTSRNSLESSLHLSEDATAEVDVGEKEHGVHRILEKVTSVRKPTKVIYKWENSLSTTGLKEDPGACRIQAQRLARRVVPKEQISSKNDDTEVENKGSCSEFLFSVDSSMFDYICNVKTNK
ncbi:uncharacterized protein LOC135154229 [Lytechinus pictus]|uniref:uncharacterized protein LOC135154229 n=1 Tax=Lytechinus pictus TaxID=7653 RepID=UPI0030B9F76E